MPAGESTPPQSATAPKRRTASELRAKIDEAGGAMRLVDSMLSQMDALRAELDAAKQGATLPAGAVVLKGDDAKAWEAYRALGKPDEVRAAAEERDTLKREAARRERAESIRAKAEDAGYAARIVERLSRDPDAAFDVTDVAEVERDGRKVKTLLVRKAGTEDAPVDLDAYAAQHFAEFAATLRASSAPTTTNGLPAPAPNGAPAFRPAYPAAPLQPSFGGGVNPADAKREKAQTAVYAI